MPSWSTHKKEQREAGIDSKTADKINWLLDVPPVLFMTHLGWRKLSHSPIGLAILGIMLGEEAFKAAVHHALTDLLADNRKLLRKLIRKSIR